MITENWQFSSYTSATPRFLTARVLTTSVNQLRSAIAMTFAAFPRVVCPLSPSVILRKGKRTIDDSLSPISGLLSQQHINQLRHYVAQRLLPRSSLNLTMRRHTARIPLQQHAATLPAAPLINLAVRHFFDWT